MLRAFLYIENPTLGVGFSRAYSYKYEIQLLLQERYGLTTASKAKGGHLIIKRREQFYHKWMRKVKKAYGKE